jgi:hypothetical protein
MSKGGIVARPRIDPRIPIVGPIATVPVRVESVEDDINEAVTARMRERLGIGSEQPLPDDVKTLIGSAAATAAQRSIELAVTRDVEEISTDVARGSLLNRFDAKVDLARKGLDHIVASDDVHEIMKRRADMLAAKKEALEAAGFSSQEAMEILLADIAARGH